ncbi:MAG: hypothetical protein PF689_10760 [Deltaproteobacteria bacterium]|nr:hypothetical protein [Deltaproteobacteria bacterium]
MKKFVLIIMSIIVFASVAGCDEGGGETCNNSNNFIPTSISIKWFINGKRINGSTETSYDNCGDVEATRVNVAVTGPEEFYHEEQVSCNSMEVLLYDDKCDRFPSGNYTAQIVFLNSDATAISNPLSAMTNVVTNTQSNKIEIISDLDDFLNEYTGTLYADFLWGGKSCENADPSVTQVNLQFYDNDQNHLSDFDYEDSCIDSKDINDLPAGDLIVRITGTTDGTEIYCGDFPFKNGAGIINIPIEFDVTQSATSCETF